MNTPSSYFTFGTPLYLTVRDDSHDVNNICECVHRNTCNFRKSYVKLQNIYVLQFTRLECERRDIMFNLTSNSRIYFSVYV